MPRVPQFSGKLIIATILLLCSILLLNFSAPRDRIQALSQSLKHAAWSDRLFDVQNATLGFERVFVLSLPERTDKRDAISLAFAMTGVQLEFADGVKGDNVPAKAVPEGWREEESLATLGSWRAHMNVIQKIIHEGIESAFILEDDSDWDVMLKSQLTEFAKGARYVQGAPEQGHPHSPYGDEWDVLWLGHCGVNSYIKDTRFYAIDDDPTMVPRKERRSGRRVPDTKNVPGLQGDYTRLILKPRHELCTFGYALSYRGAKKLLYHQSLDGHAMIFDRALIAFCLTEGTNCVTTYPTLVGPHYPAGNSTKFSDRLDVSSHIEKKSATGNIMFSTRLNLEAMLDGEEVFTAQWEGGLQSEITREQPLPEGRKVEV